MQQQTENELNSEAQPHSLRLVKPVKHLAAHMEGPELSLVLLLTCSDTHFCSLSICGLSDRQRMIRQIMEPPSLSAGVRKQSTQFSHHVQVTHLAAFR